jgi:hypothetical protein
MSKLRHDVWLLPAYLGCWGGREKFTRRNTLAFPGYFYEGSAWGMRVCLPFSYVVMHFCFASIPLRNNLNSTAPRRLKKA